ncbi:alpha/beta hydrolase [Vampirovibrio chlorellavorus]|uniref:alpha/beta hydrolase n=1 Tax=Vampirovibrio chlorellavorus TaxID=758823 RepID=UPI0026EDA205|nr:alpha/beta fold hydrolase [Vampirovibrio chlorellavorus]
MKKLTTTSQASRRFLQRFLPLLLLLMSSITWSGCEMKLPPMPWDKPAPTDKAHGNKGEEATTEEATAEENAEPAEPADERMLLPKAMHDLPFEEVSIPLSDQLVIYGRLYDPSLSEPGENDIPDSEAYQGPKYPLVILLHGLNRDHLAWSDLPATLTKAGYAVYAMDLRGHGKSTITTWKRRVSWRLLQPEQWKNLHRDIIQVIQYFKKGEDYPEVDGSQVALIGEKLGANVATFAGKNSTEVKALVLLSPGIEFKGIDASRGLLEYGNPTLILSNHDFKESHSQAQHMYNWITGPKTLQVYEKIGEGAEMLGNQPGVGLQIEAWLSNILKPVPGAKAAAAEVSAETSGHSPAGNPLAVGHNSEAAQKEDASAATPPPAKH